MLFYCIRLPKCYKREALGEIIYQHAIEHCTKTEQSSLFNRNMFKIEMGILLANPIAFLSNFWGSLFK